MVFSPKIRALSDDISLAYRSQGKGNPVIMLHGLADHSLVWRDLAEYLSDRYYCLAPDLRGHGDSSKPSANEYDSRVLAADLEAWAAALALTKAHVIAHSWAAKIALLWAQQNPQRLSSLVLVDPFFVNRLPGFLRPLLPIFYRTLPFLKIMGPFPDYAAAESIARNLKQYRDWSDLQATVFHEGMELKPDGRWGSKFAIAARDGVFQDSLCVAGLTTTVSLPTLLLLPQQGLNKTTWQLRPYKRHLDALTVQSIPGNHWPHLVEPQAFNQAVRSFLETLTPTM